MNSRIDYTKASQVALKAMYALQAVVNSTGLEPSLQELIKLRVFQINGWNRFSISFRAVLSLGKTAS
jgi:hypothetical protein